MAIPETSGRPRRQTIIAHYYSYFDRNALSISFNATQCSISAGAVVSVAVAQLGHIHLSSMLSSYSYPDGESIEHNMLQHTCSIVAATVVVPVAVAIRRHKHHTVGCNLNELPLWAGVGRVGRGRERRAYAER